MRPQRRLVVVTDVDGCLVDHATYSHAAAEPGMARLKAAGVPIVLCSSKTRAELERLQEELGLLSPFVAENGGALYIPAGAFPFAVPGATKAAGYEVIEFGRRHEDVLRVLLAIATQLGIDIVTFSEMSIQAVADDCGLSLAQARLAKLRDFDEPYRLAVPDPAGRAKLWRALSGAGLQCSSGGRYDHVSAGADKGTPVGALRRFYSQILGPVAIVGLGDSLNDLELLTAVDIAVVVRNSASSTSELLMRKLRNATLTVNEGPAGWSEAVSHLLDARG